MLGNTLRFLKIRFLYLKNCLEKNYDFIGYLMKTITKLLVQLEVTKAHRDRVGK